MIKIGLISDTHSHFDDDMRNFLQPVDQIWHAGDIGNVELLDNLRKFKSVVAVYGNIDDATVRHCVPEIQVFMAEQVKVAMMHIGGYPGKYELKAMAVLQAERPKIFVCGHSHILKVMYDRNFDCIHMNPGASGKYGFQPKRTMLRFVIDGASVRDLEVWEKDRRI